MLEFTTFVLGFIIGISIGKLIDKFYEKNSKNSVEKVNINDI